MKIVNNNIYITRGETDTYKSRIIDKATGAPFVLPKISVTGEEITKFLVQFTVRKSEYSRDDADIRKFLWLRGFTDTNDENQYDGSNDIAMLDKTTWIEYPGDYWGDTGDVFVPEINVLYRRKTELGLYDYAYYDGSKWVPYTFSMSFPFLYTDTAELAPKAYKYSMTLYGGNNLSITSDCLTGIDYKKPLVSAQFIVEADTND